MVRLKFVSGETVLLFRAPPATDLLYIFVARFCIHCDAPPRASKTAEKVKDMFEQCYSEPNRDHLSRIEA